MFSMVLQLLKENISNIPDSELLEIINVAGAEIKKRAGLEAVGIPDIRNNTVEENLKVLRDALRQMGIHIPKE